MDYYFFICFPVILGIGGLIAFLLNGRWHQLHDRIHLALLVCSVFTVYVTIRAISATNDYTYITLDNLETLAGLSICPLFFLYIRSITCDTRWHKWYWWLFLPAILLCVTGTILSVQVGWDRILAARQNDYAPFVPNPECLAEKLYLLINIQLFNITLEVMAVALIGLSIYHLARYHRQAENYFANIEESSFNNMNHFLFFGILFLMSLIMITFFIRDVITLSNEALLAISLCLSVIMMTMFYNAYRIRVTVYQKEAIDMIQDITGIPEGDNETEGEDDIIGSRIAEWETRKNKPYCKEGITLAEVAREFGITPRTLSEYINNRKGVNFNVWINTLCVEEAKHLLRGDRSYLLTDGSHISQELKIGYISDICGFSSLSSFSRTFHKIEGQSPQSYRNSINHD